MIFRNISESKCILYQYEKLQKGIFALFVILYCLLAKAAGAARGGGIP